MIHFGEKYEKYGAWFWIILMLLCLIPMAILGFCTHPLGDDFYYTQLTNQAWKDTRNIFNVFEAAIEGTAIQYEEWQGTYSAMFLMHLSPHIWGEFVHKLYPTVLFLCLTFSVFYFVHALVSKVLGASRNLSCIISALLILTFTQQVPLCGETFYWYNGSMYYTGFFAFTLVFWGYLIPKITRLNLKHTIVLSFMALFIAGGNYVSLLPTMIVIALVVLYYTYMLFFKKLSSPKILGYLCIVMLCFFLGFLISAAAPGNQIRQSTAVQLPPLEAILRSIYQNSRYCLCWNGVISLLAFLGVTPAFLRIIKSCNWKFRFPFIVCGFIFLIYCSTSCPTYYAQGTSGPARLFCLVYYIMILAEFMIYFYALGALWRLKGKISNKDSIKLSSKAFGGITLCLACVITGCFIFNPFNQSPAIPNSITAAKALANGDAAKYESQYQERLALLKDNSIEHVIFKPYDVPKPLVSFIHVGDLSSDANNSVNQCTAAAYGKKSIVVGQ